MGYAKRNKRHAQESMMKKNWTHEGPSIKKRREEIAHVQRKKNGER